MAEAYSPYLRFSSSPLDVLLVPLKSIFKIQKFRDDNRLRCEIFLISAFFISLFPLIPSGNFFNNWLSIMNFLPFSFYLYLSNSDRYKIFKIPNLDINDRYILSKNDINKINTKNRKIDLNDNFMPKESV